MSLRVEVRVEEPFAAHVVAGRVEEVAREVLLQEGGPERGELTVVITDEQKVRELNRRYRGVDLPTDVLAFGGTPEGFVEAPGAAPYLGDVVISYPHVRSQAREHGHSPDRELALLVIHGVLHLLGYNHAAQEEKAVMWARQEAVLNQVGA